MDVAALNLNIKSDDVVTATTNLDKFVASAERAAAAGGKLSGSSGTAKLAADYARTAQTANQATGSISGMADSAAKATATVSAANAHVVTYRNHLQGIVSASTQAATAQTALAGSVTRTSTAAQQSDAHVLAYQRSLTSATTAVGTTARAATALAGVMEGVLSFGIGIAISALTALAVGLFDSSDASDKAKSATHDFGDALDFRRMSVDEFRGAIDQLNEATMRLIDTQAIATDMLARNAQASAADAQRRVSEIDKEIKRLGTIGFTGGAFDGVIADLRAERAKLASAGMDAERQSGRAQMALAQRDIEESVYRAKGTAAGIERQIATLRQQRELSARADVSDPITAAQQRNSLGDRYVSDSQFQSQYRKLQEAKYAHEQSLKRQPQQRSRQGPRDIYADTVANAELEIKAMMGRNEKLAEGEDAVRRYETAMKFLLQAQRRGNKLTDEQSLALINLGLKLADLEQKAREGEAWSQIAKNLEQSNRAVTDEIALIGLFGEELTRARKEQELLNIARDAMPKGATLPADKVAEVKDGARKYAENDAILKRADFMSKMTKASEYSTLAMLREKEALGLSGEALIQYNFSTEKLLDAKRRNLGLIDSELVKIDEEAAAYARQRHELDKMAERIADVREVAGGFMSDWINGLREGGNAISVFADAAENALNRIIDKLMDRALDNFLNSLFDGPGGRGLTGDGASGTSGGMDLRGFALGGAFDQAQRFANGGAFTNQIVTQPTLFRFAKGAKLGEMGEQGPEGIFPLGRTSDGKLGVHALGGGGSQVRTGDVNVYQEIKLEGAMSTDTVVAVARTAGQQAVSTVKRELKSMLDQLERDGAIVE